MLCVDFFLVRVSRGYSSLRCRVFSLWWLVSLQICALGMQASGVAGYVLRSCRALGPRAWAQLLWHEGLVTPWHVDSSLTRDQTQTLSSEIGES